MITEQLENFYEFAKHHIISFNQNDDGEVDYNFFCESTDCDVCILFNSKGLGSCKANRTDFSDEEIEQIRKDFPEYFI